MLSAGFKLSFERSHPKKCAMPNGYVPPVIFFQAIFGSKMGNSHPCLLGNPHGRLPMSSEKLQGFWMRVIVEMKIHPKLDCSQLHPSIGWSPFKSYRRITVEILSGQFTINHSLELYKAILGRIPVLNGAEVVINCPDPLLSNRISPFVSSKCFNKKTRWFGSAGLFLFQNANQDQLLLLDQLSMSAKKYPEIEYILSWWKKSQTTTSHVL